MTRHSPTSGPNPRFNTLACPLGCKTASGYAIASTIRGWKKHMSLRHGSYSEEQLNELLGGARKTPEEGKAEFLGEVDSPPETLQPEPEPAAPTAEATKSMRTEAVSRKLSGRMNKFKKTVAEKIPQILSNAVKDQGAEWQLSESDSELLAEATENSLDVLEVDFQVQPISKTLTSPWWALIFPMMALLMIFIPKLPAITAALKAKQEEEKARAESLPETPVAN